MAKLPIVQLLKTSMAKLEMSSHYNFNKTNNKKVLLFSTESEKRKTLRSGKC